MIDDLTLFSPLFPLQKRLCKRGIKFQFAGVYYNRLVINQTH